MHSRSGNLTRGLMLGECVVQIKEGVKANLFQAVFLRFIGYCRRMQHYQDHYLQALNTRPGDLKVNLLHELRTHLKLSLSDDEIYAQCKDAANGLLKDWRARKIDPTNSEVVTRFYAETELYLFDLLAIEIDTTDARQKQLLDLATFLKSQGKLNGIDYGSGIGTLGIYFNRHGIRCDFADVSEANLSFIKRRLETRQLTDPRCINLMSGTIESGRYDFVTAFDVLEHVTAPVDLIREISGKLREGGIFIFNLLCEDEDDTLHIMKDLNPIRKTIRGFGLKKVGSFGEFKVYQKVQRPPGVNALLRCLDSIFWETREGIRSLKPKRAST